MSRAATAPSERFRTYRGATPCARSRLLAPLRPGSAAPGLLLSPGSERVVHALQTLALDDLRKPRLAGRRLLLRQAEASVWPPPSETSVDRPTRQRERSRLRSWFYSSS